MALHLADVVAADLAREQAGAFARWQLLPRGINQDVLNRRVRSGRWLRHAPGVYGQPGHADTFEQRLWIAWLAVGPTATVSHESAAELHGMPSVERGHVVLTAPHPTHQRIDGVFVHQITDVAPEHRTAVRGLPTTTVARTIVDLAGWVGQDRLLQIVDAARACLLVSYEEVGVVLTAVARRGKPGCGRLARVLDILTANGGLDPSLLQHNLLKLLMRHHLPPPVIARTRPGRPVPASCVQVSYPEAKLVIELDGRRWQSRAADARRDDERDAEVARDGWETLRLLHEHLVEDSLAAAATIADLLHRRRAQAAS